MDHIHSSINDIQQLHSTPFPKPHSFLVLFLISLLIIWPTLSTVLRCKSMQQVMYPHCPRRTWILCNGEMRFFLFPIPQVNKMSLLKELLQTMEAFLHLFLLESDKCCSLHVFPSQTVFNTGSGTNIYRPNKSLHPFPLNFLVLNENLFSFRNLPVV